MLMINVDGIGHKMKEQPLHEMCDTLYSNICRLDGVRENIDHMRLPTAYIRIKSCMDDLDTILGKLRNIALREEGGYGE